MSIQVLRTQGLVCGYDGRTVLKADIQLNSGTVNALFGANGAGKSTLLKTLAGLIKPIAGRVYLKESDLSKMEHADRARTITYLDSSVPAPHGLTAEKMVLQGRLPHMGFLGRPTSHDWDVVVNNMKLTGCLNLGKRQMPQLSDGERKRVMLALCLSTEASVILADEPTAQLDPRAKADFHLLMLHIAADTDRTFFFATHDVELSGSHADCLMLISSGNLKMVDKEELNAHFTAE